MNNLEDKYQQFLSDGKAQSDTLHFWHEYLNDIELSLNYVKAEKIPDWQLHLACCADIISKLCLMGTYLSCRNTSST